MIKKICPITDLVDEGRFVVKVNGRWMITPLFLSLVFIETSDVIFAVDSVPAIFAVTREPLLVFTSNIFAILGLRSLYFLMARMVETFRYLKVGLGFILIFVGSKMSWLGQIFDGKFPIHWSLLVICSILVCSIVSSLMADTKSRKSDKVI